MNAHPIVEPLEDRIAPASTFTFTDVDGDLVTISSSKGDLANAAMTLNDMNANSGIAGSKQLAKLDISDAQFAGTNLTIAAKPQNGLGDGFVNVGWLEAGANNLGMVKIDGDLGEIDAGDGSGAVVIKKLQVQSIGKYGTTTGGGAGLVSSIDGGVDSIAVKGDVVGAFLNISGSVKTLDVKGSLIGGANAEEGIILANGGTNMAKFGGSIIGGAGANTGVLGGSAKMVVIGGDVRGGSGSGSGVVAANKVTINGSILGGSGNSSGFVSGLAAVSVKFSVVGGAGESSGIVNASNNATVKIGGSLIGGQAEDAGSVSAGNNANVSIGGDIVGGTGVLSGTVVVSSAKKITVGGSIYGKTGVFTDAAGGIYSASTLGDVSIKGSVISENGGRAFVMAQGMMNSSTLAISKLTVGGSVDSLDVMAGYRLDGDTGDYLATNGDASIGAVKVAGNWSGSNLVAGVETANTATGFRINDSTLINGHDPAIIAKIVSLTIGGQAMGFAENAYFNGFVAEQVPQKFKVGKRTFTFVNTNDVLGIGSTYNANEGLNFLAYRVTMT